MERCVAPPKALGKNAFITGLVTIEDELIQLLDLELLLAKVYPESLNSKDVLLNDMEVETLRGLSILLVDDSVVARKQLSDVLDRKNIEYQVTHDGSDAMARILSAQESGRPIDILVSDIEMPGLDGYELAFKIRNHPGLHQPWIILHSSLSSEMSVSYAEQVGANRALTKFDAHELLHTMLAAAAGRALDS
ncbi:response regulator [Oceanisphaera avium]|uniref:response regulator n=1 Tax=Oceanisphaera avium TaxID=1903694 RepID=UPI00269CC73F